ncbi:hypothetical protein BKA66DRAFT_420202 [Pyrenochaeta sp. MPI-SDFR-AT-0127]|nr:hypothetical protein BKA66DRAFT_420202 [Pyrenochaeta sp. MPI-SDFR-AT-0127]
MVEPTSAPVSGLVDSVRRLSINSNESSQSITSATLSLRSLESDGSAFSLVSDAPSVQSLDSSGSIAGGVSINKARKKKNTRGHDTQATQRSASITNSPTSNRATPAGSRKSNRKSRTPESASSVPTASPFWYQFPGFQPSPTAPFKKEFARLAKHQGWGTKAKRKRQTEALNAEIAFHHGTCMQKLGRWQELCEEVGIEETPPSITQCKKELKSVFVNLFNLIDHRRNPDIDIMQFKSYREFSRNIRAGNTFPRDCAKQDGFISVLLKKL